MGSGTDIARETANMIVADDNFKSIVAGVKEGRVAYANIRKIILFLISCGLTEVLFFCLSILSDMEMPLVAIQLLWINVVTDGIQDLALSFEKAEKNIMKEKPISPQAPLFDKNLFNSIMFSNVFTLAIDGLGKYTSQGSSLLVMMILGGAVLPPLQGMVADYFGVQMAFFIPMICYAYLVWYGFIGCNIRKDKSC
jgi:magnesium-transporting ATPase (P-type)